MATATRVKKPQSGFKCARDAILRATVEAIDAGGETSVRITEVAREAGVTQGMISYYFGDREGLVAEAHLARFRSMVDRDTHALERAVADSRDVDHFYSIMSGITREVIKVSRARHRLARIDVIGSAYGRPDLLDTVTSVQSDILDQLEHVAATAIRRGFIRADLSARAIAEFVSAYSLGLVVADMDPTRPSDEDIARVIDSFTHSLRPT